MTSAPPPVDSGGGGPVTSEIVATIDGTETTFTLGYVSIPAGGSVASWVACVGGPGATSPSPTAQLPAMVGTHADEMRYRDASGTNDVDPAMTITITEHGPAGSVIRGTFSGTMTPIGGGTAVTFTDGRFTVPHPVGM